MHLGCRQLHLHTINNHLTGKFYQQISSGGLGAQTVMMCMQLWRKYLTNTKVSFVENDAECAKKHKAEIEAVAKGKVYVGEPPHSHFHTLHAQRMPLM